MTWLDHPFESLKSSYPFPIPEGVLLKTRVCDLGVRLSDTGYEVFAGKLSAELQRAGLIHIQPNYYLADEWFCPDGSTTIAIPFWLAHPQLKQIEKRFMGHAEGGTSKEFMQLLRHEAGHCVEHAYRLSARKDWRSVFGNPSQTYSPDHYAWNKSSRDFVRHLPDGYAQSHPEEDFTETFAVWLDPRSAWRTRYRDWEGALAKLKFVDQLMKEICSTKPRPRIFSRVCQASRMKQTLAQYYSKRPKSQSFDTQTH